MKKLYSFVVPIAGLIVVLGVAYGLDNWIESIRKGSFQNFSGTLPWLIPTNIAHLAVASSILILLWFIYDKRFNNRVVALIYAVVGLGLLFYTAIAIALADRFPLPVPIIAFAPKSFTTFTSAIVAVVGVQQLFMKQSSS